MQRLKLLGLAIIAVLALSAVATSVASAATEFLPGAGTSFKAASGAGKLQALNAALEIKCLSDKGTGETTTTLTGTFTIEFEDCTGPLGVKCADLSRGDSTGIIATSGTFDLRMGLTGQPLGLIRFLINTTHLLCALTLVTVLGCVVGEISKGVEELTNKVEVLLKQTGGENTISSTDKLTPETEMESCILLSKKGSEAEETAGEETHEELTNFTKSGVEVTALIHI